MLRNLNSHTLMQLRQSIKDDYTLEEILWMENYLHDHHAFDFPTLSTGLFPSAIPGGENEYTGYHNVWVRDNVFIANARYETGHKEEAVKAMDSLMTHFINERPRFKKIINGIADPADPMNRPHVRFNGETLGELAEKWPHAQNDALGYFLWLYSRMAKEGIISVGVRELEQLAYFPLFLSKIEYWHDEDSGHWEEKRKIEASSIGASMAGLISLKDYLLAQNIESIETEDGAVSTTMITDLIREGENALNKILPFESRQSGSEREADSSLLFLIDPLSVIDEIMADKILVNVKNNLQGDHGIKRYKGDSFWSANYKQNVPENMRTVDVSDDMSKRDSLLTPNQEAEWCIFDPTISAIYGKRYQKTGNDLLLDEQVKYFNRAIMQITEISQKPEQLLCPELYYVENNSYIQNDIVPLLWSAANLSRAFLEMKNSLSKKESQ